MKTRILLVENQDKTREQTAQVLRTERYEVFSARTVEEARAIMVANLVHVALIDVRLVEDNDPNDVTGLNLCKELDGNIPRIIVTAHPDWQVVRTVAESLIEKGARPEVLLAEIPAVLSRFYDVIPKRRMAILTSGGDAPGMNAAIWSALHTALANEIEMFAIYDGYHGLMNDSIKKLRWSDVADTLTTGGTMLGTARSREFKEKPEKRRIAAHNLIKRHIDGLIVVGGDGSMQGARALVRAVKEERGSLEIVALPGTIDNDLGGTDMSIGAASAVAAAMHEIDNMIAPARALRRVFVIEVMGRHSGFLTLELGLCVGADAVLLPEELIVIKPSHVKHNDWQQHIDYEATRTKVRDQVRKIGGELEKAFSKSKRHAFVLFAEGTRLLTTTEKGRQYATPINLEWITELLDESMNEWTKVPKPEVRSQTLGYPMRGAPPSRFDMHLGITLGSAAVKALMDHKSDIMLGWSEKKGGVIRTDIDDVVAQSTRSPQMKYADHKGWERTVKLQRTLVTPLPRIC